MAAWPPVGGGRMVDAAMAAFDEATTTRAAVADDGGGAGHAEEAALPARREATTVGVPQHPNTPTPQREGEGGEAGVDAAAAGRAVRTALRASAEKARRGCVRSTLRSMLATT